MFPTLRSYASRSNLLMILKMTLPWAIYCLAIIFALPVDISLIHRIIFFIYAVFVFWILHPKLKRGEPCDMDAATPTRRIWITLLAFSFLFLIASRLYMFIRYGATPLGYDTGFYWQYFNLIAPNGTSAGYVSASTSIAYTPWFPLYYLGLSAIPAISILHVFHQLITVGALYFLVRSFQPRISSLPTLATTVFLFAISINQFMAFWWMFFKQSMAFPFLIFATGLFIRGSWIAIPIAAFGAAIHPQSAIPFGIGFALFLLYEIIVHIIKKQPMSRELLTICTYGIIAGLLFVLVKGPSNLLAYFEYFKQYRGFASNAQEWEMSNVKGLYIPFSTFRINAMFYLPFALTGILTMHSWFFDKAKPGRHLIMPIVLFASLILASFPFLYQNRTLIILDAMLILIAAYPITVFAKKFLRDRTGPVILGLLLLGSILFASQVIWNHPPQLYSTETREIKKITQLRKPGDYAMALTSLYTPWVFAYTGFEQTIVPGWLTWDQWDLTMWGEFWNGESNTRRLKLLSIYGSHDIYIFSGTHFNIPPLLEKFLETDPHFTKISPHVWKYSPALPDINLMP